ncbi:glycosyltransferase family 2 protein [Acidithiobacillus ferriphilus]|uniref:glycosyltransferase family 2 protein n=1 Tax=Acidithiobacillus ferriphilus TaxID=1689834 RepID=UPI001D031573|nr:glycosyltransferase [Acidithiobacillus ferriphilus]
MIAVVLINWNGAADTLRCLRVLADPGGRQAQVMVVDSGSEAANLERLRLGVARWGLAVELLQTGRNLGFGGGCNAGMRLALERGAEFEWPLHDDATLHPDACQGAAIRAECGA